MGIRIPHFGGGGGGPEAPATPPPPEAPRPPAESAEPTAEQQAAAQALTAQKKGGATAALKGIANRVLRGDGKPPFGLTNTEALQVGLINSPDPATRQKLASLAESVRSGTNIDEATADLGPEWRGAIEYEMKRKPVTEVAKPTAEARARNPLGLSDQDIRNLQLVQNRDPAIRQQIADLADRVAAGEKIDTVTGGLAPEWRNAVQFDLGKSGIRIDPDGNTLPVEEIPATEVTLGVDVNPAAETTRLGGPPGETGPEAARRMDDLMRATGAYQRPATETAAPIVEPPAVLPVEMVSATTDGEPPAPGAEEPPPEGPIEPGVVEVTQVPPADGGEAAPPVTAATAPRADETAPPPPLGPIEGPPLPPAGEPAAPPAPDAGGGAARPPGGEPPAPPAPEPAPGAGETGPGNLTPGAQEVLARVDAGEIPLEILAGTDIPASLRTHAEENGITIQDGMTVQAVVDAFQAKAAASPARVEPAAIIAEPAARPVEAAIPAPIAALRAEPAAAEPGARPAGPAVVEPPPAPAAAARLAEAAAGPAGAAEAGGATTARLESAAPLPGEGAAEDPYAALIATYERLSPEQLQRRIDGLNRQIAGANRRLDRVNTIVDMNALQDVIDAAQEQVDILQEIQDQKGGPPEGTSRTGERRTRGEAKQEAARRAQARADKVEEYSTKSSSDLKANKTSLDARIKSLRKSLTDAKDPDEKAAIEDLIREADADKAAIDALIAEKEPLEQQQTAKEAKGEADRLRREQSTPTELQATVDALKTEIKTLETQLQADSTNADLNEKLRTARTGLGQEEEALKAAKGKARQERGIKDKFTTEDIRRISNPDYLALPAEEQAKYLQELFHGVKEFTALDYDKIRKEFEGGGNPSIEERARFAKTMVDRWKERGRPSKDDLKLMHHLYGKNQDVALAIMENWAESEAGKKALKEQFPSMSEQAWRFVKKHKNWFMILAAILAIGAFGPATAVVGAAKFAAR